MQYEEDLAIKCEKKIFYFIIIICSSNFLYVNNLFKQVLFYFILFFLNKEGKQVEFESDELKLILN